MVYLFLFLLFNYTKFTVKYRWFYMYFNFVNSMNLQGRKELFWFWNDWYIFIFIIIYLLYLWYFYLYTNPYLQKFSLQSENPRLKQRSWSKVSKKLRLIFFVKKMSKRNKSNRDINPSFSKKERKMENKCLLLYTT